jgi:hypothetical protein
MTQTEVRQLLNGKVEAFQRGEELWDTFDDSGIQVCYGCQEPYRCCAVMLYQPANPIFQGWNLLDGTSIEDWRNRLVLIDNAIETVTEGVVSYKFGIYLSTQDYHLFDKEPPESIVVFERGYYDDLLD